MVKEHFQLFEKKVWAILTLKGGEIGKNLSDLFCAQSNLQSTVRDQNLKILKNGGARVEKLKILEGGAPPLKKVMKMNS